MERKRLQIAIEFMTVFSFILLVFTFLFALISTQRAQTLSNQEFEQGQLVAQNIAAQLDRAFQAGNGYYAAIPITSAFGTVNYQLAITKNGAVIVNTTIGKQVIQAVSYSSVKSISSNPSFIPAGLPQSTVSYYLMPISNGTLTIQNSFGTICVDYSCPTTSSQAGSISLSSQVVHAPNFNGQSSYIDAGNGAGLSFTTAFSIALYLKSTSAGSPYSGVVGKYLGSPNSGYDLIISPAGRVRMAVRGSSVIDTGDVGIYLFDANWHQVVAVATASSIKIYEDGNLQSTTPGTWTAVTNNQDLTIGARGQTLPYFNGLISNVQIYNTALNANQVQALYLGGIGGAPVVPANVAGWWPLNWNANDYGGNGFNGNIIGPLTFTTVSQLSAKVMNQMGQPISNTLTGFATTAGVFIGSNQALGSYTNSNGIATAFLNQAGNNGQAVVEAVTYNGNTTLGGNLVGWWPLSLGQGGNAHDYSGYGNNGVMNYAGWSAPNYVSQFDGISSYVAINAPQVSTAGGGYNTASFWMYWSGQNSPQGMMPFGFNAYGLMFGNGCFGFNTFNGDDYGFGYSGMANRWVLVTAVFYNGPYAGNNQLYINGVQQKLSQCGSSSGVSGSATSNFQISSAASAPLGYVFLGSIANLQVYNTALTQQQVQQIYQRGIAGLPLMTNLVGWWPLDGDTNDYSSNGNNGIIYGNLNFASTSSIPSANSNATSIFASSFNGVSSIIASSNTQVGINSVTVAAWVYPNAIPSNTETVLASGSSSDGYAFNINQWTSMDGGFLVYVGGAWHGVTTGGSAFTTLNKWYFITGSYDGSYERIYINGVPVNQIAMTGSILPPTTATQIGYCSTCSSKQYFYGSIADAQVYSTALTQQQVQQLYQEGVSGLPISGNSLVGWWPLNGNANDYSSSRNNGAASNIINTTQQAMSPYLLTSLNSYGANFNGQSSYISTGTNSLPAGNAARSVFAWVYWNGGSSPPCSTVHYYGKTGASTLASSGLLICGTLSNSLYFDGGSDDYQSSLSITPKTWTFVGYTYAAWSTSVTLYVNGQAQTGALSGSAALNTAVQASDIGYCPSTTLCLPTYYFNGSIANLQVYNTALTQQQVQQLYQSLTPPSASTVIPLSWVP